MRLFLAGNILFYYTGAGQSIQKLVGKGGKLHSYFYCKDENRQEWSCFKTDVENKVDIMIDSGAYSADTQGVKIDINDYIKFIKQYSDVITACINLDVIGDGPKSYRNWKIMKKAGIDAIPVYHLGTDEKWLLKYLEQTDYIAVGAIANVSTEVRLLGLTRIWENYLLDEDGFPKVKVHALGLTSLKVMQLFPWYSVDSTSWVATARMGGIFVPKYRNGKWVYDEDAWKITVSSRSPKTKDAGQHINTLSPKQKQILLKYIHEKGYKLGKSEFVKAPQTHKLAENERWAEKKPKDKNAERLLEVIEEEGISNKYQLRDELNIIYFQDLEKTFPPWPWSYKQKGAKRLL